MEEQKPTPEIKSPVSISQFNISFGDLSNLESLVNDVSEKMSKKGFNIEHFEEMKKIIWKVKKSKNSE